MKKLLLTAASVALGLVTLTVQSQDQTQPQSQFAMTSPSQNDTYVELNFVDTDLDSGIEARGFLTIDDNLSAIGSLTLAGDLTMLTGGAAYVFGLDTGWKAIDIVAHAELEYIDLDVCVRGAVCFGDDDMGLKAGAEARVPLANQIEAFGDVSLRTTYDTDVLMTFGARFSFTEKLVGVARVEFSDFDVLAFGVRYKL